MRLTRLALSFFAATAVTAPLAAQLRSNRPQPTTQNLPRLLVANPYAANTADSSASVRVGDGMRKRMSEVAGRAFNTISREQMNEALLQYAYPADAVLPPSVARTLASQLQARFLVSATLSRAEGGRYAVQVRAIGLNDKAGHAVTVQQAPSQSLEDFGKSAADQLSGVFKALDDARKCWDQQTAKPADAAKSAANALKDQPGYGFAEYCLGEMAKASNAPPAQQLTHYSAAAKGDPLSLEAWSMAAVQYQNMGDSANTVKVFQEMLRVAPTNQPLREQAFRLFINYGQPQAARQVAEEGLAIDPTNADLWDLKSNACLFLEDFTCAVDALEQVFAVDSAKADSTFFNKINVAASQKPDTARFLKWSQLAVKKYPTNATQLAHLASAYSYAGPLDSALTVTQRLMVADSSDLRPALRTIQALVTAKRARDANPLGGYVERLGGADDKQNYALILINGALPLLQQEGQDLPTATDMARKAVAVAPAGGRVATNGHYILGLAVALQLPQLDAPIMEQKSCDLARQSQAMVEEASASLALGQSVRPDAVAQYQKLVESFRPRIESQVKAFCK
jgi:tetratricopeptide (TPR) repeat protein